jgi:hypothetical protein
MATTSVSLTSAPTASVRFYSDASCTNSSSTATIALNTSTASFYVKPVTGGGSTISAASSFGTAMQTLSVVGAVRRGTCTLAAGMGSISCTISPAHQAIASTVLFFQATNPSLDPGSVEVSCQLASTSQIQCRRAETNGSATVQWQTAELPQGLTVQRASGPTCLGNETQMLAAGVNPASSFVLSSFTTTSNFFGEDDHSVAQLSSSTVVTLSSGLAGNICDGFDVQVVDLAGLSVSRGVASAGMPNGALSVQVAGLPASSANTALLHQFRTATLEPSSMCNLAVRGELSSATSLKFSRGAGVNDGGCSIDPITDVLWERLDFGTRGSVQVKTVPVTGFADVAISSVDPTRTVVFAGGQSASGQSCGETSYNATSVQAASAAVARFELTTPTNVRVTRDVTSDAAIFTFYVVQLEP